MPDQPQKPERNESQSVTSGKKPEVVTISPRIVTREDKTPTTKRMIGQVEKTLSKTR